MPKKIDMTGWVMAEHGVPDSYWTVIKQSESRISNGKSYIYYLCKCKCGKEQEVRGTSLRSGRSKSCGCIKELSNKDNREQFAKPIEIGTKFGKLTVIKNLGVREAQGKGHGRCWSLCQCDCGNAPIEVPNDALRKGKSSCGYLTSKGEAAIQKILDKNQITYKKEYSFPDLLSEKNHRYRFDFAIFQNNELAYLIEFDGIQHFDECLEAKGDNNWSSPEILEQRKQADKIKNQYCIAHKIPLKRIPYYDFSKISLENLESDKWNVI